MRENEAVSPNPSRPTWRYFDGAVSISVSMLLAVLLKTCQACGGTPLLEHLKTLTEWDDGVIITATLLLLPTSLTLYGGLIMYFAAKEFVERRAEERDRRKLEEGRVEGRVEGRQEGRVEGRQAERERIQRELAERGVPITPELASILSDEAE